MARFERKNVLVTGAAGGIGAAAARAFRDEGARVFISDLRKPSPDLHVSDLPFHIADVTRRSEVDALVDRASSENQIDILVHTAALLGGSGPFDQVDMKVFETYLSVNLMGTINVAQSVARKMIASKTTGSIILLGSVNSLAAEAGCTPYVASKGAVRLLAKAMAVDLAGHGIRVNSILPGPITVPRNEEWFARQDVATSFRQAVPMGRPGRPEELIAAMFYLADSSSSYTTGSDIVVDGGLDAFLPLK
jgi:NAD(P)-dependent dehydrogenase (short-subunit alcohol dehydrogenase family)